jgi:hypothetical protein
MGEPADDPGPKKRRRWPFVAMALLASLLAWWNWPRGDARFVGTWAFSAEGDSTAAEMVLRGNGSGYVNTTNGVKLTFPWRVSNDQLIIGSNPEGAWGRIRGSVASSLMSWLNVTFLSAEQPYPVLECTRDVIRVREGLQGQQVMVLKRIVE